MSDTHDPKTQQNRPPAKPVAVSSDDLFKGAKEVLILHAGETYRLRLTRNGRLILTK